MPKLLHKILMSAMELQLGVFRFFTHPNKCKQTVSLPTVPYFMRVYFHAQTTVHMHLKNHSYFDRGEKAKYPRLEPHAGIKMEQILGFFGLYLWSSLKYKWCYHKEFGYKKSISFSYQCNCWPHLQYSHSCKRN